MSQEAPLPDFDREVAQMQTLATALTDALTLPTFTFPTPPTLALPGIAVVRSEDHGGPNADA